MTILKISIVLIALWALPWKIYAVWLACKNNHRKWFLALILLNTLSILEMYYVFYVLKKSWTEVKQDFKDGWLLFKQEFKKKKEEVL